MEVYVVFDFKDCQESRQDTLDLVSRNPKKSFFFHAPDLYTGPIPQCNGTP
jgi:hypothetical protein